MPATAVVTVCPDCPTSENLNEPVVKETVSLALQRFNEESGLANYFTLENITRASSQVTDGERRHVSRRCCIYLVSVSPPVGCWTILLCGVHHSGDSVLKDDRCQ